MARVLASERTRNQLKAMLDGETQIDRSALVRQAARLIMQEALEAEAAECLGRGYASTVPAAGAIATATGWAG
jgi:transposase-like protein